MNKQTEINLFMVSSLPRFYQQLLSGVGGLKELGNRILKEVQAAYAFRQVETVRELSRILINMPIKEYQLIAQYYLVWCQCRELKFHDRVLENIIEQTQTYKSKALISRAAFEVYRGNIESALNFYNESFRANPSVSDYIVATRGIATIKSIEGFHASALKDLERLLPLIRYAEPLTHYEVINSYAVELAENNRLSEAYNVSLIAVSSPFGPHYKEWGETFSEIAEKQKNLSCITVITPQKKPKQQTPKQHAKIIDFPKKEEPSLKDIVLAMRQLEDIQLTPMQMLGVLLKVVLRDRITDEEIDKICSTYFAIALTFYEG